VLLTDVPKWLLGKMGEGEKNNRKEQKNTILMSSKFGDLRITIKLLHKYFLNIYLIS
jgi:hypothetical protein